ncbi:MAG: NFACT family protein [Candidatus Diapherotrites archaeon]|uniref:NFACT family protein n=1 Tax=Candidatus Iainarchaeum sp. TaxID=3101447 RepID=A0A939C9Q4_9ARCH|nr:NFACT family protein [Candidatus Diapherotrites archaeon]
MQIPNLTLAYQIAELKPLVAGTMLRNVQELEKGWLKLKLQTRQGSKDLIVCPSAFFITSYSFPAKHQTSGYGAFLRKHLRNKRIMSLEQHGFDRIALLEFQDFFLVLELFAKGNLLLLDREMQILSAYRKEQWKDRILKKGQPYRFPSSKGISPLEISPGHLKKAFSESNADAIRSLISAVNIAPVFAEAAFEIAGIEKGTSAPALNEAQLSKLASAVKQLYSVDLKKCKPGIMEKEGEAILVPVQLPGPSPTQALPSVNNAIDSALTQSFSGAGERQPALDKKKAQLGKSIERQKLAIKELQNAIELNRAKANAIYSNYSQVSGLIAGAKSLLQEKKQEKDIMYKLKKQFPLLLDLNLKQYRAVVKLKEEERI